MRSSTFLSLLTVFLFAVTISSAYPGEEKKEEKEVPKEGGEEGKPKEGEENKTEEETKKGGENEKKNGAPSLYNSSGFLAVLSLAVSSLILSIH